jgi:putative glycosyltransferase (TIGR04348 family)
VILLTSPAAPDSVHGNGVTARRWADILGELGHRVRMSQGYPDDGAEYTALVALHAKKSADAVRRFRARQPDAPVVIALTGTDLYPDLRSTGVDPAVLATADRLVVLQRTGLAQLEPALRARARVIIQSVPPIPARPPGRWRETPPPGRWSETRPRSTGTFDVALLAHLREVKDPLLVAAAARLLPASSTVRVRHLGAAMDEAIAAEAKAESAGNPRYEWLGPRPRDEALALLARSHLLVLTSRHEGGANVVSEALAAGVPVISSHIPGSIGLLGEDYPGYFPVGDAAALAGALDAAEHDRDGYYDVLRNRCAALRAIVEPARERQSWADLLTELGLPVTR